jgi:lipopolysaccharide transport system ATP-binding protein
MTKPTIEVQNLSKVYELGILGAGSIRDAVHNWWDGLGTPKEKRKFGNAHWAVNDISFTVNQGEIVGLIGRNGSGKSTTLKILSKITAPTKGKVILRGRFSSLLEVGTGFHRELSGRENIYLNGTILGMQRKEITQRLDEIIAFSEIEKFIDTPVKKYSSGMNVRLAFAVAAHLNQQILMIDEVLAVGDLAFQQKCLEKTRSMAGDGRTIIFVSHDLDAVARLCNRCIYLKQGKIVQEGPSLQVIENYLKEGQSLPVKQELGTHVEACA